MRGKNRRNRNSGDGRATPTRQGPTQDMLDSVPWLGPAFARILAVRDHAQDPMLVQLALQASVATCCARSLSLFCVGFPSKLDGLLSRVFSHVQVAGKHVPSITFLIVRSLTVNTLQNHSQPQPAGVPLPTGQSACSTPASKNMPSPSL